MSDQCLALSVCKSSSFCWILFSLDLSKLFHGFLLVVRWICENWFLIFSDLLHGFVKIDIWSSLSCYMDLLELLRGFVKVLCIFRSPLAKQTKLKLDQDFKTYWSFCFGLEVLNESKYSMPWVRCAFGNVSLSRPRDIKGMNSNVPMEPAFNADERLKSSKVSTWHQ